MSRAISCWARATPVRPGCVAGGITRPARWHRGAEIQRAELIAIMLQELKDQTRIGRIVLSTAMRKGLAVIGQGVGIDGIDANSRLLEQHIDQTPARSPGRRRWGGRRTGGATLEQLGDDFGGLLDRAGMGLPLRVADRVNVFRIGPVDSDQEGLGLRRGGYFNRRGDATGG